MYDNQDKCWFLLVAEKRIDETREFDKQLKRKAPPSGRAFTVLSNQWPVTLPSLSLSLSLSSSSSPSLLLSPSPLHATAAVSIAVSSSSLLWIVTEAPVASTTVTG